MRCLIDADVLRYEIGFASETAWKHKKEGEEPEWFLSNPPPWEMVEDILLRRIGHIEYVTQATEASTFFFTGKTNFRNEIAKRKPYKQRAGHKPYHFNNIGAYIKGCLEYREQDGLEADDLMAIEQTASGGTTIICTRDKDLRSVDGWHFGWELNQSPQFGPLCVDGYGHIALSQDRKTVKGYGLKFFLVQCLTGDVVDSVPGLPRCGPVAAFEALEATQSYAEGLEAVLEAYRGPYGDAAEDELLEQGRLLWMTRKLHEDGSPVLWELGHDYGA